MQELQLKSMWENF